MYKNWMQPLGIAIMVIIIVYLIMKIFKFGSNKEGFSTDDISFGSISSSITGSSDAVAPIETAAIESLNATIQSKITLLQDQLLLSKNKSQYETTIINMDDYINLLMMQQILNTKLDSGVATTLKSLESLNILKASKDSLNTAMNYLDKQ